MANLKTTARRELTGRVVDAMSNAEKERIFQEIDQKSPETIWAESTPPNSAERKRLGSVHKKIGRPKLGKGTKVVSVTVEIELLKRADAYAKRNGLKRAELFTQGLRRIVPEIAP